MCVCVCDLVCLWKWVCVRNCTHTHCLILNISHYHITYDFSSIVWVWTFTLFRISETSVVHCCKVSHFQGITCKSKVMMKFLYIFFGGGGHSCEDRGEGQMWGRAERTEGGNWLLQASREQDRWLDTGQGYTAKGCKRAMGKPCVCHLGTYTHSNTDAHICTPLHSRNHVHICHRWWEESDWSKRRNRHLGGKKVPIWDCSCTSARIAYFTTDIFNFSQFSLPTILIKQIPGCHKLPSLGRISNSSLTQMFPGGKLQFITTWVLFLLLWPSVHSVMIHLLTKLIAEISDHNHMDENKSNGVKSMSIQTGCKHHQVNLTFL